MRGPKFGSDIIVAAVVLIIVATAVLFSSNARDVSCEEYQALPIVTINVSDSDFSAEVAESQKHKSQGLSGRTCIGENKAMLFSYDESGNYCFWMKEMSFSIDMVWLNDERKIIETRQNVNPETYPDTFCSSEPARYVLEFQAGTVARYNWDRNTYFNF